MKLLEDRILKDGQGLPGGILKVDGFLNHRIDPQLFYDMAEELKRRFRDEGVNKILTIEASGISLPRRADRKTSPEMSGRSRWNPSPTAIPTP